MHNYFYRTFNVVIIIRLIQNYYCCTYWIVNNATTTMTATAPIFFFNIRATITYLFLTHEMNFTRNKNVALIIIIAGEAVCFCFLIYINLQFIEYTIARSQLVHSTPNQNTHRNMPSRALWVVLFFCSLSSDWKRQWQKIAVAVIIIRQKKKLIYCYLLNMYAAQWLTCMRAYNCECTHTWQYQPLDVCAKCKNKSVNNTQQNG